MMEYDDKCVMVAAIDFGTTFSGYAFSFKGSDLEKHNIKMNKNWGSSRGFQSYKTPTSVLTKGDKLQEFVAFGYEAEERFAEVGADEETSVHKEKLNLYKHFKMVLHKKKNLTTATTISSTTGQIAPAIDIFVFALRYLKESLLKEISQDLAKPINVSLIRWVITVPAIWSEESKQFMREAAFRSGLIQQANSRKLIIALEPEAASFFCRQLDVVKFTEIDKVSFPPGTKYLVIDCGGGTNDMVLHEVLHDSKVREIASAKGGPWGGICIDAAMENLMKAVLSDHIIESFVTKYPDQWLAFMTKFERSKKIFRNDGAGKLSIELPFLLPGWFSTQNREENFKNAFTFIDGVSYRHGLIVLSNDMVQSLFKETTDHIMQGARKLLQNHNGETIRYIFMVGGFSESPALQDAVIREFGGINGCTVLIPREAQLAIIRGAVLFGHEPQQVTSRIARQTYGIQISESFNEAIHDKAKHFIDEDGDENCENVFQSFVDVDTNIELDTVVEKMYKLRSTQQNAIIPFYCSTSTPKKPVQYTDDPAFNEIGKVVLECPDLTGGKNRKVNLKFKFGRTEISVEATDITSGNKIDTTIDFISDILY